MRRSFYIYLSAGILFITMGCNRVLVEGEQPQTFRLPVAEAEWIRNGEPLEFEGKLWYPQDDLENLVDSEVYLLGEYTGVQIFSEKQDIRPLNRIYTKFGRNKYRLFLEKKNSI